MRAGLLSIFSGSSALVAVNVDGAADAIAVAVAILSGILSILAQVKKLRQRNDSD